MLTREEDVEIHALHKRGWSISAIARHTGRNRRTIRNYITGVTTPGVRKPAGEDSFAPFADYVSARLREDPHLWARTLCDELEELGFKLAYPNLTRNIRARGLRPVCQECRSATDRPNAIIEHDPGDETQRDWLDLPDPPASWGWGEAVRRAAVLEVSEFLTLGDVLAGLHRGMDDAGGHVRHADRHEGHQADDGIVGVDENDRPRGDVG